MSMADALTYYAPPSLLFLAAVARLWTLRQNWHDRLLRSVCALLVVGSLVLLSAAPPTASAINAITGIPNVAAPVVYCILAAFSGSCILLVIHWRGGEEAAARRATRLCLLLSSAAMIVTCALFVLADAPVERLRDFDTFYAATPFIREMILLYLVTHTVASVTMAVLCGRWAREVHGVLRTGLVLLAVGFITNLAYDVAKYIAIIGVWTGKPWEGISTDIAPLIAGASSVLVGAGFVIPPLGHRIGDQWQTLRRYRGLEILYREMVRAATPSHYVLNNRWARLDLRLTVRESFIDDGILHIKPDLDPAVWRRAYARAIHTGQTPSQAEAVAAASMVAAAADVAAARSAPPGVTTRPSRVGEGLVWAVANFHSPTIDDAVRRAAMSESSPL
ncbi:MAB_1171c family putative transporter [Streptomyces sp. NPDC002812]|uniref:MAB_1171c family putative transporter n=1 Tax=Streptomyces sp. NPDC002812 TaxID=3154434 RepID=UPI00331860AA